MNLSRRRTAYIELALGKFGTVYPGRYKLLILKKRRTLYFEARGGRSWNSEFGMDERSSRKAFKGEKWKLVARQHSFVSKHGDSPFQFLVSVGGNIIRT